MTRLNIDNSVIIAVRMKAQDKCHFSRTDPFMGATPFAEVKLDIDGF
jgi:hypothetical protein